MVVMPMMMVMMSIMEDHSLKRMYSLSHLYKACPGQTTQKKAQNRSDYKKATQQISPIDVILPYKLPKSMALKDGLLIGVVSTFFSQSHLLPAEDSQICDSKELPTWNSPNSFKNSPP